MAFIDSSFYSEHTELVPTALRNSGLISIAPTGTISTMLKVSGGIEPLFDYTYTRKTESLNGKDTYYKVETPIIQEVMEKLNITSLKNLPEYCITAKEIPWQDRIAMQSVIQRHVDQAISSTINLPKTATVEDIEQIYIEAWRRELKGVTVYREGCSRAGILTSSNEETSIQPVETPVNAVGKKRKVITGCGSLHVLAYFHPKTGKLLEVYLNKGSTGGCHNFMSGLSRMISLTLRLGGTLEQVIDQLKSTGACPSYAVASATKHNTSPGACCPMAVGNALMDMSREMKSEINGEVIIEDEDNVLKCPVCGNALAPTNGCFACSSCGWSKCN